MNVVDGGITVDEERMHHQALPKICVDDPDGVDIDPNMVLAE
ncbi:hypothetical protein [Amycolatopsis coloradensis]|nr:hypothetical protein [Amycolatopsis coloradensis]